MGKLNLNRGNLRKFGITMSIAFLVITLLIFIRHRHSAVPTAVISAVFFVLALAVPFTLKQAYIFWMRLAFIVGWINTRLILVFIFYFFFTPIGLLMKLFHADLLERKISKKNKSYWKKKEQLEFNRLQYEKQF